MNKLFFTRLWLLLLVAGPLLWTACKREEPNPSLLEYLDTDGRFSQFRELMALTNLDSTLNGRFYYTLLAPTDDAFAEYLAAHQYASLSDVPADTLLRLAIYHIQVGWIEQGEFLTNYYTTPAAGIEDNPLALFVENNNGAIQLNGTAKMGVQSLTARDGVIHVLDGVLTPPTVLDLLQFTVRFSTMYEGLVKAGLADTLRRGTGFSLFTVRNEEFAAFLAAEDVDSLGDFTLPQLRELMGYHVMDDFKTFQDMESMVPAESFPTFHPDRRTLSLVNELGTIRLNDEVRLLLFDIHGTNGVMHLVDRVIPLP